MMSRRHSTRAARLLEREPEEDELARLIVDVRHARERLSALIAVIKADRAGWQQRERAWVRWRNEIARNSPLVSDKVH